ncbi:MAG: hypothetical protein AB2697_21670 [Candidatus Thiodiazotropha endolucinida]
MPYSLYTSAAEWIRNEEINRILSSKQLAKILKKQHSLLLSSIENVVPEYLDRALEQTGNELANLYVFPSYKITVDQFGIDEDRIRNDTFYIGYLENKKVKQPIELSKDFYDLAESRYRVTRKNTVDNIADCDIEMIAFECVHHLYPRKVPLIGKAFGNNYFCFADKLTIHRFTNFKIRTGLALHESDGD